MTLVEFVPPTPHPLWKLCPQMGITDVIVKVNPELTGLPDPWRLSTLRSIVERLKVEGLNVVGLEGDPFDMTPIKEYGAAEDFSRKERKDRKEEFRTNDNCHNCSQIANTNSNSQDRGFSTFQPFNFSTGANASAALRETTLAHYRELLESMARLGIKLLCYNFMVGKGWSRTGVREGRGGAKATYFSLNDFSRNRLRRGYGGQEERKDIIELCNCGNMELWKYENGDGGKCQSRNSIISESHNSTIPQSHNLRLTAEQVWANYEYFIKAVMPTAEKCGVRMALHPDDPCLDSLGGYARIFGSIEAYDRACAIYPSPSNAVTFCQANFKLMLGNGERETVLAAKDAKISKTLRPLRSLRQKIETIAEAARHFGKRIAFIHVRDVEGTKEDFTELFHDQGDTDQFALMRVYRELGLDVPVRGDHVPEMAYDRILTPEGTPGYFTLGRLFANGYLKALLKSIA